MLTWLETFSSPFAYVSSSPTLDLIITHSWAQQEDNEEQRREVRGRAGAGKRWRRSKYKPGRRLHACNTSVCFNIRDMLVSTRSAASAAAVRSRGSDSYHRVCLFTPPPRCLISPPMKIHSDAARSFQQYVTGLVSNTPAPRATTQKQNRSENGVLPRNDYDGRYSIVYLVCNVQ